MSWFFACVHRKVHSRETRTTSSWKICATTDLNRDTRKWLVMILSVTLPHYSMGGCAAVNHHCARLPDGNETRKSGFSFVLENMAWCGLFMLPFSEWDTWIFAHEVMWWNSNYSVYVAQRGNCTVYKCTQLRTARVVCNWSRNFHEIHIAILDSENFINLFDCRYLRLSMALRTVLVTIFHLRIQREIDMLISRVSCNRNDLTDISDNLHV